MGIVGSEKIYPDITGKAHNNGHAEEEYNYNAYEGSFKAGSYK